MKYIVKDIDGQEHGPIDEATLAKWVDEDRVTAETQIRSEMLPNWKPASKLKLLEERLAEQAERRRQVESTLEKSSELAKKLKQRFSRKTEQSTAFVHRHKPQNATITRRIYAWIFDLVAIGVIVLTAYAGVLAYAFYHAGKVTDADVEELRQRDNRLAAASETGVNIEASLEMRPAVSPASAQDSAAKADVAMAPAVPDTSVNLDNLEADRAPYTLADSQAGYGLGSRWRNIVDGKEYICLDGKPGQARWIAQAYLKRLVTFATIPLVLLIIFYYGFCYGFFAQTFGMWYWGIFIIRKNIEEVYFFRAFIYTLMMFVFGIFTPVFLYVFNRGLHDLLAGVRVINVAGTTKD